MARINLVQKADAKGHQKELLETVEKKLGGIPNFMKAFANSPSTLNGFLELHDQLGRSNLSLKTRERIALLSAQENCCDYCLSAHSALGAQAGLSEDEIIGARRGQSADNKAEAALTFAKSVIENKGDITSAELHTIREAGYGDGEIVEIIGVIALNIWTNLLGKVGQIDIDFPDVPALNP